MNIEKVTPRILRPLPSVMRGVACIHCDKTQASWNIETPLGEEDRVALCSICFLNETEWAKSSQSLIVAAVENIQQSREETFMVNSRGCPAVAAQADHVLGVLVLADRVRSLHKLSETLK